MPKIRYEFNGTLYGTRSDMLDAIAIEWASAGGTWSEATQLEIMSKASDMQLAVDAIEQWKLNIRHGGLSHMEFNDYSTADLADAFARLRERLDARERRIATPPLL
jgi:hypothetical protein